MLQATLMASDGKLEEADKLLAEAGGNSGTSQDVLLMRAQLLSQSQPERAADLLGSLTDESFTFAPHIIFTQVITG